MEPELYTHELKNNIRLIHRPLRSEVAHFGLLVHTGTRDELRQEHGLAHFMEHMFFKGTRKRSAYQIISRLEDVGGELNAYTTKEETAIFASFLKQDYTRAIELIQDIFLNSSFPEKERHKEAGVVLNEIQSYDDSPSELIFDRAEELLFPDHPIGRNILGTGESLKRFRNGSMERFQAENYSTNELVLSSIGDVPFGRLVKTVERYFAEVPAKERIRQRIRPVPVRAEHLSEKRNTCQVHCILVGEAYALSDSRRLQLYLLNNILGGPGMNSRLNLALRERRGLSYSAESHYSPYTDTGTMMVYFSCDREAYGQCFQTTLEELKKLRKRPITYKRLANARKQLTGQLAISYENNEHLMLTQAKRQLIFDRVESLETIRKNLEAITAKDLMETANEILDADTMNILTFK